MNRAETETSLPRISIIMPVYNTSAFLSESLDSIIAQTYQSWEAILIDDGSTDGSGEICDRYAAKDARIRVIHQPNSGVAVARNVGLDAAQGEFISFVDSDDWIDSDMLATLLADLENNDADVAKCGVRAVEINSVREPSFEPFKVIDGNKATRLLYENKKIRSYLCDKLYRRNIFNVRFPEGRIYEDMSVLLLIFSKARKVTLNSTPLYNYRQRSDSIVHSVTIDNKRQLTKAVAERYKQVEKLNIEGWSSRDKKKIYLLEILKICRDIVRYFPQSKESAAFLDEMRSKMQIVSLSDSLSLGPKYMFRLLALKTSPKLFSASLNATRFTRKKSKLF